MPIGGIIAGALSLGKKVFGPKADGSLGLGQKLLAKIQQKRLEKGKNLLLPSVHGQVGQQVMNGLNGGTTETGVPSKNLNINASWEDSNDNSKTGGFKKFYSENKTTVHVAAGAIVAFVGYVLYRRSAASSSAYSRR